MGSGISAKRDENIEVDIGIQQSNVELRDVENINKEGIGVSAKQNFSFPSKKNVDKYVHKSTRAKISSTIEENEEMDNKIQLITMSKAELKDVENTIGKMDEFLKNSNSFHLSKEYPLRVEELVNKSMGTMKQVHEYAEELYKSVIVLRKRTDALLEDAKTNIQKLVAQISGQSFREDRNNTSFTEFGNPAARNEEKEKEQRDLILTSQLENILKTANASLQNQNLQAVIVTTTKLLNGIKHASEITKSDTAELDHLVNKWTSHTRIKELEEKKECQKEKERKKKKEEEKRQNMDGDNKQITDDGRKTDEKERREREENQWKRKKDDQQSREKDRQKQVQRIKEDDKIFIGEEKTFIYNINGKKLTDEHNDGICCVVCAIPEKIVQDDFCCFCGEYSEYNIRECIGDDEQIASLITNIQSANGQKFAFERPLQINVPHQLVISQSRSIVVKVSIDEGEWQRIKEIVPYILEDRKNLRFVGFEMNNFTYLKILVVTTIKPEKIIVPKEGMLYQCVNDRDISVNFPESLFKEPTQASLKANSFPKTDTSAAKVNHTTLSDVYESTSLISFDCCAKTDKKFQLAIKDLKKLGNNKKFNAIYKEKDGKRKLAEYKLIENTTVVITIPEDVSFIRLIGLSLPRNMPIDQVFEAARMMEIHSNEIKAVVVCKQKQSSLNDVLIACISSEEKRQYVNDLMTEGYSEGPTTSREFCVSEGEKIHFSCSGNIDFDPEYTHRTVIFMRNRLAFLTCNMSVINKNMQKTESYFRGYLMVNNSQQLLDKLPLFLEKKDQSKEVSVETNLIVLIKYISWKLSIGDNKEAWNQFVSNLDSASLIRRLTTKMQRYYQIETKRRQSEEFLKFWIKEKGRTINKVDLIMKALQKSGFDDLNISAKRFLKCFEENGVLSDRSLIEMSEKIGTEWESLGINLGLTVGEIDQIKPDFENVRIRIYHMLDQWRMSDRAIELDQEIISVLVEAMNLSNCDKNIL